jgi:hypothetical protein
MVKVDGVSAKQVYERVTCTHYSPLRTGSVHVNVLVAKFTYAGNKEID